MQTIFNVRSKDGQIIGSFHFVFCERNKENLQLDLEIFYLAHGKEIPATNVEIQIDGVSPFSLQDMLAKGAHIHEGNDKKWYVCYPKKLTMDQAIYRAGHWSIITAFHMQCQADVSFFESFDRWMSEKRDIIKKANTDEKVSAFEEFAPWILHAKGWKLEMIASQIDILVLKHAEELLKVLILPQ